MKTGSMVFFKKVEERFDGVILQHSLKRGRVGFGVLLGACEEKGKLPEVIDAQAGLAQIGYFLGDWIQEFFGEKKTKEFVEFVNKKFEAAGR